MISLLWMSLLLLLLLLISQAVGFIPPPPRGPPRGRNFWHLDGQDDGGYDGPSPRGNADPLIFGFDSTLEADLERTTCDTSRSTTTTAAAAAAAEDSYSSPRGGDCDDPTAVSKRRAVVDHAVDYWKAHGQRAATAVAEKVSYPYKVLARQLSRRRGNDDQSETTNHAATTADDKMQELLRTTLVQRVTVPNSTVLPPDVIEAAARQSNILGQPLIDHEESDALQSLVARLNRWYQDQGFMFHMVTGATLRPETATAELTVQEPRFGHDPIGITVYKEMIPDPTTNELLSKRQYRRRYGGGAESMDTNNDDNNNRATLVPTAGRVQPHRIAQAMDMKPGAPFRIDPARWDKTVASSGLFSSVLQTSPLLLPDGTLQLHISAKEAPMKQLEYGIGKSLYTGGWEGEMEFRHGNVWGGGESLQVNVRKATEDGRSNSVHVAFNEGRLTSGGGNGYHLEAFSEYYQDRGASTNTPLFRQRQGASIRVHTPRLLPKSTLTESLERHANNAAGNHAEVVASSTVNVGPYDMGPLLPFAKVRANVDASVTFGLRVANSGREEEEDVSSRTPYATASATTRQLIPIGRTRLRLALRHTAIAATPNLPHHVARTIGTTTKLRGAPITATANLVHGNNNSAAMVKGSTELRIPVPLPQPWIKDQRENDASVVLFVDYLLTAASGEDKRTTRTCAGIGLRKSFQGIPLQCDIVLTSSGKIKPVLGIGSDFVF